MTVMYLEVTHFGTQELIGFKGKERIVLSQSISVSPNTFEIHPLDQQCLESSRGGRGDEKPTGYEIIKTRGPQQKDSIQ